MAEMVTTENATISVLGRRVFGLDLHSWELVMLWSLGTAAIAAFAVVISTAAVVKLQKVELAEVTERTAEANARTKEAELKLVQLREKLAPRHINGEQFVGMLEGKPKAPVEIVFPRDDAEAYQLAMQIRDWLRTAKWDAREPAAITGADEPRMAQYPSAMGAGGQPSGITVVRRVTDSTDFKREKINVSDPHDPIDTPMKALTLALGKSLGAVSSSMDFVTGKVGELRVVVGPKP
jgi:hypothetical protein